jgi:hypothetical protein
VLLALSDKPYAIYSKRESEREREKERESEKGRGTRRGRDKESKL